MTTKHVVVDGSNIATEGRSTPSLQQLDEAVQAFLAQHPHDRLTVVVDATFGHRIDKSEQKTFEDAVDAGELISPPAGAVGRGDAFVLQIADRAGATVLSNDSFQEFHGQYSWLFDTGRLVGGKPVPDVGWVFLERIPVRGPASRKSVQAARLAAEPQRARKASGRAVTDKASGRQGSGKKATAGKKATPPKKAAAKKATEKKPAAESRGPGRKKPTKRDAPSAPGRPNGKGHEPVNDTLTFIEFVGAHPVGSIVQGTVENFASHGAYVRASEARCYVPLKSMGDPPPRSAKDVLELGETRDFIVTAIDTPRRGLDLAVAFDSASRAEGKRKPPQVAR